MSILTFIREATLPDQAHAAMPRAPFFCAGLTLAERASGSGAVIDRVSSRFTKIDLNDSWLFD